MGSLARRGVTVRSPEATRLPDNADAPFVQNSDASKDKFV
jgi:hypothetical protein